MNAFQKIVWIFVLTCGPCCALPVPRFVSLRSDLVNCHIGPGKQYPVVWQFVRKGLPLEVIDEFDMWRKIRDIQGAEGWIHKSMLCSRRTIYCLHEVSSLLEKPDPNSRVLARLEPGVIGRIVRCKNRWCALEVKQDNQKFYGWVEQKFLWGVYPHETKF